MVAFDQLFRSADAQVYWQFTKLGALPLKVRRVSDSVWVVKRQGPAIFWRISLFFAEGINPSRGGGVTGQFQIECYSGYGCNDMA